MLVGVRHSPFELLQAKSHDVGFREAELAGQLLQPPPLSRVEIYLKRFRNSLPSAFIIL